MSKKPKKDLEILLPSLYVNPIENDSRISPTHPSFEVTDFIYAQEHSNFVSRLSTPISPPKLIKIRVPCNYSIKFPNPHEKMYGKEDIYLNPTALYLSRKPLAYKRNERRTSNISERIVSFTPTVFDKKRVKNHRNNKSFSLTQEFDPLQQLKNNSNIKGKKVLQEEALKRISQACKEMESFTDVSPRLGKAKRILDKYVKNFEWTTTVLKSYSEQESEVLRQLYILSEHSRNEISKDMANTADEIKKGTMDPALKHKKRKILH